MVIQRVYLRGISNLCMRQYCNNIVCNLKNLLYAICKIMFIQELSHHIAFLKACSKLYYKYISYYFLYCLYILIFKITDKIKGFANYLIIFYLNVIYIVIVRNIIITKEILLYITLDICYLLYEIKYNSYICYL